MKLQRAATGDRPLSCVNLVSRQTRWPDSQGTVSEIISELN